MFLRTHICTCVCRVESRECDVFVFAAFGSYCDRCQARLSLSQHWYRVELVKAVLESAIFGSIRVALHCGCDASRSSLPKGIKSSMVLSDGGHHWLRMDECS